MPPPGRRRGSVHPRRGARGGRAARYEIASRLTREEQAPPSPEIPEDGRDSVSDQVEEESSSDDDAPGAHSYNVLLAAFQDAVQDEPRRKKRRMNHDVPVIENAPPTDERHSPRPDLNNELDEVDEEEEQGEAGQEEDVVDDGENGAVDGHSEDDEEDVGDAFETRFDHPEESYLAQRLRDVKAGVQHTTITKSDVAGKCSYFSPGQSHIMDFAKISGIRDLKLKQRLAEPASRTLGELSPIQRELAPGLFNYADLLFGGRTVDNAEELRNLACLHAMNHLYKTRDRVLKNTARLAVSPDLELRDQGFTRPKVLIMLETRQMCVKYMDTITRLCSPEQQENRKRFQDAFIKADPEGFGQDKPADFRELFEGNDDNEFRIGIKFTRKTIKYYSQFYNSDIILASPLGLRRAMKDHDRKNFDYDFLSSIEVLILDQADAMLQQNWAHVLFAFSHLNRQPANSHPGTDYSRIRMTQYLESNAVHFRQTVVFSTFLTPELNALFTNHMRNISGAVKASPIYAGAIETLPLSVRGAIKQTFVRIKSSSVSDPSTDPDDRFRYFTSTVIPSLTRLSKHAAYLEESQGAGALIFIPTYHDFVRVRNFFSSDSRCAHLSFGSISEYSDAKEVRRARSHFYTGKHDVMLVSGRAHHFRRYRTMQGTRRIVFYSVPENPEWYKEVVAWLEGVVVKGGNVAVRCVFSRWEGLALERIVGTKRIARMVKDGREDIFDFM